MGTAAVPHSRREGGAEVKQNLWDATWLVANAWVMYVVPAKPDPNGWHWFIFWWATVNVTFLLHGLIKRGSDALIARMNKEGEHAA